MQLRPQPPAMARQADEPLPPLEPPGLDHMFGFLNTRRDLLLTILRKSVELNEPLICSI